MAKHIHIHVTRDSAVRTPPKFKAGQRVKGKGIKVPGVIKGIYLTVPIQYLVEFEAGGIELEQVFDENQIVLA